jgi:hypothetical protein
MSNETQNEQRAAMAERANCCWSCENEMIEVDTPRGAFVRCDFCHADSVKMIAELARQTERIDKLEAAWVPVRSVDDLPKVAGKYLWQMRNTPEVIHIQRFNPEGFRFEGTATTWWVNTYEAWLPMPQPYIAAALEEKR